MAGSITKASGSILLGIFLGAPAANPQQREQAGGTASPAQIQLLRDVYKELIEINTTDSAGDCTRAANAMAARLRRAGYPAADVQVLVPPGAPKKGNLVARLRGKGGGRKPLLLACCVAYIIIPYPIFSFLLSSASFAWLIAVQILFAVLIAMFSGPGPAAISEIFPTRARSLWMTTGYALAVAIFGGFAPSISIWLIDTFNSPLAHTFYLMAAAAVSTVVIAGLRETAHEELQ